MVVEDQSATGAVESLRGHVIAALVLFALDAFVLGQGFITALVVLGMTVVGLVYIAIGVARDRARLGQGIRIIAIYLMLGGGVFGTIHLNNVIARHRANRIIAALKAYKAQHGCYPQQLADLVPEYLSSIPIAKYALWYKFLYFYDANNRDGFLMYTALPPFGRPTYNLKTETWRYLD